MYQQYQKYREIKQPQENIRETCKIIFNANGHNKEYVFDNFFWEWGGDSPNDVQYCALFGSFLMKTIAN